MIMEEKLMKIGVISVTLNATNPITKFIKENYNKIEFLNYLDSGLIEIVNKEGKVTNSSMDRMKNIIRNSIEDKVDGIYLTCTVFSPYVKSLSESMNIPIVSADRAMITNAFEYNRKTAVLYTFPSTITSTSNLISSVELEKNKIFNHEMIFVEGAFEAIQKGNLIKHDELIMDTIKNIEGRFELVVLAQISMAHVAEKCICKIPILTSPKCAMNELIELIDNRNE